MVVRSSSYMQVKSGRGSNQVQAGSRDPGPGQDGSPIPSGAGCGALVRPARMKDTYARDGRGLMGDAEPLGARRRRRTPPPAAPEALPELTPVLS
jgi:hypothetical protein